MPDGDASGVDQLPVCDGNFAPSVVQRHDPCTGMEVVEASSPANALSKYDHVLTLQNEVLILFNLSFFIY